MKQQSRCMDACFRQKYVFCLAFLLLLCMLSACGQDAKNATVPKTPGATTAKSLLPNLSFDPCALFAKSEAAKILGSEVTIKADSVAPICRYEKSTTVDAKGPSGIQGASISHSVLIVSVGTSEDTRQYLALDRVSASSNQSQVQEVKGVGDAAFIVTFTAGKALVIAQGNTILSLGLFYPVLVPAEVLPALERLAQSALHAISVGTRPLSAPKPHPCMLVTANEASHLLQGEPVKWFFTTNNAGSSGCDYISPLGMQHRVVIGLTTNADAHSASMLYDSARQAMKKSSGHDMSNLGEAAFYDGQNTIWILKGNTVLHVTPFGSSVLDTPSVSLWRNAVARI